MIGWIVPAEEEQLVTEEEQLRFYTVCQAVVERNVELLSRAKLAEAGLVAKDARIAELEADLAEADEEINEALLHNDDTCNVVAERDRYVDTVARVVRAIHIADNVDVTGWQRGYRALAESVQAAIAQHGDPTTPGGPLPGLTVRWHCPYCISNYSTEHSAGVHIDLCPRNPRSG